MVPYKMIKHQAQDSEENLFRQCLADKYPNVKQSDYAACTQNVYSQRVELLMTTFANTSENLFAEIHWVKEIYDLNVGQIWVKALLFKLSVMTDATGIKNTRIIYILYMINCTQ